MVTYFPEVSNTAWYGF